MGLFSCLLEGSFKTSQDMYNLLSVLSGFLDQKKSLQFFLGFTRPMQTRPSLPGCLPAHAVAQPHWPSCRSLNLPRTFPKARAFALLFLCQNHSCSDFYEPFSHFRQIPAEIFSNAPSSESLFLATLFKVTFLLISIPHSAMFLRHVGHDLALLCTISYFHACSPLSLRCRL